MPTSRRQFIKQSFGVVSLSFVMPSLWLTEARGQSGSGSNRRVLLVVQLAGGNDGLNTVIPYTDARYASLRPGLGFKEAELKDAQGQTTIITDSLALHPSMSKIKQLYDTGKVAIVLGVGYPNPDLSHFTSMDIWHTANPDQGKGNGWLGRYADIALVGKQLAAISLGVSVTSNSLPKTFLASKTVIPNIKSFESYGFQTDQKYPGNRSNRFKAFAGIHNRSFPEGSFLGAAASTGSDAVAGTSRLVEAIASYSSSVVYPANSPLAPALKMAAQVVSTIPEVELVYAQMGGFDNHARQIDDSKNKTAGFHATLLQHFSEGVRAFYDDMAEHGLADDVLILQWSEFGRRPNENGSLGTDHGTAAPLFLIGNPVRGGIHGQQPSLAATDLDTAGNLKFTVDFRSVYATVLDRWLGVDSGLVLGNKFENIGFLG